jgi:hypothetical protein
LTASLIFPAVVLAAIVASAQAPTRTANWVNIKDPTFGAMGNGRHDDTAAIQKAIDYAFAHNLTAVYCPAGVYKTTSTIYLDPPGNLRTNWSAPTEFQFTMAFFGDPKGSGAQPLPSSPTCQVRPTFNNAVAFIVGPGQGMRVSDIAVVGPNNCYRGNCDPNGVGIGIAGGSGGASNTLIRDTFVRYFYVLYMTDANAGCCLADSNTLDHVGGDDGFVGIYLYGTQSFINHIAEPVFGTVTIAVENGFSHQTQIIGGNLSAVSSASGAFTISGASAANCGAQSLCLTATVASPDGNIPNVYDSFTILTPHFGLIPFSMTAWDAGTNVISLKALDIWEKTNYGGNSCWYNNDIFGELNAATILYASERVRVVKGRGVELDGTHVENNIACTTFFDAAAVWTGQLSTEMRNPFFDYNTSLPQDASQANKYCQQAFPFIDNSENDGSLKLSGGNWSPSSGSTQYPLLFDTKASSEISGSQLNGAGLFNLRFVDQPGRVYGQINTTDHQMATVARGTGVWDAGYFLPSWTWNSGSGPQEWQSGELQSPFCGFEPCPSVIPNLSPTLFGLVCPSASASAPDSYSRVAYTCGSLDVLGSYPPIASRTVFKSVDWNSGAPNKLFLHSGHGATSPGWSWGQDITLDSVSGGSAQGNAAIQNISGTTLTVWWMNWGTISVGDYIVAPGIPNGTKITAFGTGSGGSGTYTLSNSASLGYVEHASVNSSTNAVVTGSIAGNILTVTAVTSGALSPGDTVSGTSVASGTVIIAYGTGTGGTGTYVLSNPQTIASRTLTAPSVAWTYSRGSSALYLDAATMAWMFPGLGISIDNGEGAQPYTVTGAYPYLGYVTVIWAGDNSGSPSHNVVGLLGNVDQVYSCSSGCTIGQAPFAWMAY